MMTQTWKVQLIKQNTGSSMTFTRTIDVLRKEDGYDIICRIIKREYKGWVLARLELQKDLSTY